MKWHCLRISLVTRALSASLAACLCVPVWALLLVNQVSPAQEAIADLLPSAADRTPRQLREARNRFFSHGIPSAPALDEVSRLSPPLVHTSVNFPRMPALPSADADSIVVGKVTRIQPYLSEDRRALYTEFSVDVEQVAKSTSKRAVVGEQLTITRPGGVARMPTGLVARHVTHGYEPLTKGQTYLLFLVFDASMDAFGTIKVWAANSGIVTAVSIVDLVLVSRGQSEVHGRLLSDVLSECSR